MAKKLKNTSSIETNLFHKGMNKDTNASFQGKDSWYHARNAYNNSVDGDVGLIGNEPANLECGSIPYSAIGAIHKQGDEWFIFSTDDSNSEIGLFDDSKCQYTTIVNNPCLNFNRKYLITGASKENYDCTWQVYWDDNLNPSRTLNVDDIPWVQVETTTPGSDCKTYEDTEIVDCEKLRLAPLVKVPCIKLTKASDGGQIINGSYQAFIAYVVNEQKVTDYIGVSNIQSLFDHLEFSGSLNISIENLDQNFEDFELVILSNTKNQYVAKKIGIYSTAQTSDPTQTQLLPKVISLDFIDPALISIPFVSLFKRSPAYEKSEAMYVVNDWLIRQGPTEQFDFNYQPLANQIRSKWTVAEYPSNYYFKGGNKTGLMRDEQYAFFIRWIYNTGERSASYHIPGRAPRANGETQFGDIVNETAPATGANVLGDEMNFQVFNTATITGINLNINTDDGGIIIAEGDMAYWESTERYPARKPEIWDGTYTDPVTGVNIGGTTDPNHDLCGKPIRHHKMPTEELDSRLELSTTDGQKIRILGVRFENIKRPKYNDGTYIENIVGYEILRGSREGAKSILAKGIFRNMRKYDIPDEENLIGGNVEGLYPNYPYNDLADDIYFQNGNFREKTVGCEGFADSINTYKPLGWNADPSILGYKKDVFTFHSPELMFKRPFLSAYETRIYGTLHGEAEGQFTPSEKHPKNKLLRNGSVIISSIIGIGYALAKIRGKVTKKVLPLQMNNQGYVGTNSWSNSLSGGGGGAVGTGGWYISGGALTTLTPDHMPGSGGGLGQTALTMLSAKAAVNTAIGIALAAEEAGKFAAIGDGGETTTSIYETLNTGQYAAGIAPGTFGGGMQIDIEESQSMGGPFGFRQITGFIQFLTHFMVGTDEILELFYNFISLNNFAYKHNSHGQYTTFDKIRQPDDLYRRINIDANYIGSAFQTFGQVNTQTGQGLYKINNLFRPDTVAINTDGDLDDPTVVDRSRYTLGSANTAPFNIDYLLEPTTKIKRPMSALYGALKFQFENQYGQLEGIKQVQMRGCVEYIDPLKPDEELYYTEAIFSGDVYINRYTEKTIMPIFTDFMYGQPDETIYDYFKKVNLPYPRYWMNTEKYQINKLIDGFLSGSIFSDFADLTSNAGSAYIPEDLFYLDRHSTSCGFPWIPDITQPFNNPDPNPMFAMKYGYMYTHVNGIQDFFVESEVNLAQRDWEDIASKRHYDPFVYTGIKDLFHADIIKDDNFYKYDFSLSASRFITNLTSYGNIQPRDYNPQIAETCFSFYPKRLIYSLQAQEEAKKDFWRVFLANNYKDFKDKVNVIKPVNKSGAIIFFPYRSPQMFQGLDQLQTDLGTKLTIGDGGLFSQPFQNLVNSDLSHEYGSCESARSVINTPLGIFYMSQAQGKIFQYGRSLNNIANKGMKWWFNKYLPSILIKQFPELVETELADNPVVGVGCQSVYDSNDDIVYFIKKDYSVKEKYKNNIQFDITDWQFYFYPDGCRTIDCRLLIELGDLQYFNDASWTVSYDPKANAWISFHDWHPELVLPSINHFLTTKTEPSDPTQIYCPPGYVYNPQTEQCEITGVETIAGFSSFTDIPSITAYGCPQGYTYNPITNQCIGQTINATTSSTTYLVAAAADNPAFGQNGTRFYDGASATTPPFTTSPTSIQLFDSSNNPVSFYGRPKTGPGSVTSDPWWRRLKDAGIWTTLTGSVPSPCGNLPCTSLPCCEWIGFITCIEVTVAKEYVVLIAGDNAVRFYVDGVLFADLGFGSDATFKEMHVLPIFLTVGTHSITMEGYNNDLVGGFVGEIYDLTLQQAQDPSIVGSEFMLAPYRIWSSIDQQTFTTGQTSGNTCPPGYSLVYDEDCDDLICVQIADATSTCACAPDYTLVYPTIQPDNTAIWNSATGSCNTEVIITPATPAGPSSVPPSAVFPGDCPIDIVFAMQADDSTYDHTSPGGDLEKIRMIEFVQAFIQHPDIAAALNAGTMQVGATLAARRFEVSNCWSPTIVPYWPDQLQVNGYLDDRYNFGGGVHMSSTEPSTGLTPLSIATNIGNWMDGWWFGNPFLPNGQVTDSARRPDHGQAYAISDVLTGTPRANSQKGDRSSNPNYRSIVIHVTGQTNDWLGNVAGCAPLCFRNNNICNVNLNPPTLSSMVIMMGAVPPQGSALGPGNCWPTAGNRNWLAPLNFGSPNSIFGVDPWDTVINNIDDTVNEAVQYMQSIACPSIIFNPDPNLCNCYEFVLTADSGLVDFEVESCDGTFSTVTVQAGTPHYPPCARNAIPQGAGGTVSYVNTDPCSTYSCDGSDAITVNYEARCRKVECGCPPVTPPQTQLNQIGSCDGIDIYAIGNPSVSLPTISCQYDTLLTTPSSSVTGGIWRHNYRCDLYANYYGVDYPWEIEFVETTGQMVNTVRSVEYQLESYVYKGDLHDACGDDRWHDLDFNFDEAIVYNTEQVSGLLRLELDPKNDPFATINYPIIGASDIRILYSKEEQKYRFNQFWDATNDRGEFTNVEQQMFITELNGYIKDLNAANLNYQKATTQRKKFRHYYNKFLLRRRKSGNRKMMLKIDNTKLNLSFR